VLAPNKDDNTAGRKKDKFYKNVLGCNEYKYPNDKYINNSAPKGKARLQVRQDYLRFIAQTVKLIASKVRAITTLYNHAALASSIAMTRCCP